MGVFNCIAKTNVILVNIFIKAYINCIDNQGFLLCYCFLRTNRFVSMIYNSASACKYPTPYYSFALDLVKECEHISKFSVIKNKVIYGNLLKKKELTVELKYLLFNWNSIWNNFHNSHINLFDTDIIYKHLHDVLTVKKRL